MKPMYSASKYLLRSPIGRWKRSMAERQVGCPIRRSRDQRVLSPPPGLSQSATSFIASCRQGIHQTPFSRLIRSGSRTTPFCAGLSQGPASPPLRSMSSFPIPRNGRRPGQGTRSVFSDLERPPSRPRPRRARPEGVLVFLSLHDVKPRRRSAFKRS